MEIYQVIKVAIKVFNNANRDNVVTLEKLLRSKRGKESISIVRSTVIHYAITHMDYSPAEVARIFNRHRTTAMSDHKTIAGFLEVDKKYQALYKQMTDELDTYNIEYYITD